MIELGGDEIERVFHVKDTGTGAHSTSPYQNLRLLALLAYKRHPNHHLIDKVVDL